MHVKPAMTRLRKGGMDSLSGRREGLFMQSHVWEIYFIAKSISKVASHGLLLV